MAHSSPQQTYLGLGQQLGAEQLQLLTDCCVVTNGVGTGAVNDMNQGTAALAMAEELVAKAVAVVGSLQQPCGDKQDLHERQSANSDGSTCGRGRSCCELRRAALPQHVGLKQLPIHRQWRGSLLQELQIL